MVSGTEQADSAPALQCTNGYLDVPISPPSGGTQFQVYAYDGDGRAEVAMKTADATVDGVGTVIGSSSADYRNSAGYVLSGPEYLTMFSGLTGAALSTVNYDPLPQRQPDPAVALQG